MVPLLQLISRGSPMTFEDSNRIIPLFYLFSSLFSHSLISVHDSEFFGHEMEGQTVEQFSQSELLFGNICFWGLRFPSQQIKALSLVFSSQTPSCRRVNMKINIC